MDKDKDKDGLPGSPAGESGPSPSTTSTSFGKLMRRSSWNKGRISLTNSLKTLVSPNNVSKKSAAVLP